MSFSSVTKEKIISEGHKSSCCNKAFLNGVLSSKGASCGTVISLNVENDFFASYIAKLVLEFYGKEASVVRPKSGGRCRTVTFDSKAASRYIEALNGDAPLFSPKCPGCTAAFLRGFFFACGRLSDPEVQYSLEFSPIAHHKKIIDFLTAEGIDIKTTLRRGTTVLYLRRSSMIEDFFALANMNSVSFVFMNAKIEGEFRNNTNRVVNCETNNINKAVDVSQRHIGIINRLIDANLISFLPDELAKTALLRVEHSSLSLAQLAAICVPAISKSGLIHRLNKISEYAEQLLQDTGK